VAPLLIAAVVGGGAALAGAEVLGLLDDEPATVETTPATAASAPTVFKESDRLSVNQIYRDSAPGVVQIRPRASRPSSRIPS